MVEWSWWDSGLICKTNWFPSVLWHCWFGHMTCKIVPDMTYNVFGGTLNLARSITEVYGWFCANLW